VFLNVCKPLGARAVFTLGLHDYDKKLIIADYSLEIAIIHYDYNILTHNIGIL